jgi:hypothetical protein
MTVYCDCYGPPWPKMKRIHVGGELSRFYLCRRCGTIREEAGRPDGTLTGAVRYHKLDSVDLPAAVVEQARATLDAPHYDQLSLFGDDQ